jgi:hypothetical protein
MLLDYFLKSVDSLLSMRLFIFGASWLMERDTSPRSLYLFYPFPLGVEMSLELTKLLDEALRLSFLDSFRLSLREAFLELELFLLRWFRISIVVFGVIWGARVVSFAGAFWTESVMLLSRNWDRLRRFTVTL